jgi:hypothetical protein
MKTILTSILYWLIFVFVFNNIWTYIDLPDIQILLYSIIITWIFGLIISKAIKTIWYIILWLIFINIFSYFMNWNIMEENYIIEQINNIKNYFNL